MDKIWLVIRNLNKNYTYFKYFETEHDKDKYKRKVDHIPYLMIVEDSTDINWNYK